MGSSGGAKIASNERKTLWMRTESWEIAVNFRTREGFRLQIRRQPDRYTHTVIVSSPEKYGAGNLVPSSQRSIENRLGREGALIRWDVKAAWKASSCPWARGPQGNRMSTPGVAVGGGRGDGDLGKKGKKQTASPHVFFLQNRIPRSKRRGQTKEE